MNIACAAVLPKGEQRTANPLVMDYHNRGVGGVWRHDTCFYGKRDSSGQKFAAPVNRQLRHAEA